MNTQSTIPQTAKVIPAFKQNRFSAAKTELKGDLERYFAIEPQTAYVLTEVAVDEFIKAEHDAKDGAELGTGKAGKKGDMTVKIMFKAKVVATPALKLARACAWCAEAKDNGINGGTTEWQLSPELSVYVNDVRNEIANGKHDKRFAE